MHRPGLGHEPVNVDRVLPRGLVRWIGRPPGRDARPQIGIVGIVLERDQLSGGFHGCAVGAAGWPVHPVLRRRGKGGFRPYTKTLPAWRTHPAAAVCDCRSNQLVRHGNGNAEVGRDLPQLEAAEPVHLQRHPGPFRQFGHGGLQQADLLAALRRALGRRLVGSGELPRRRCQGRRSWLPASCGGGRRSRGYGPPDTGSPAARRVGAARPPLRTEAMLPVRRPRRASGRRRCRWRSSPARRGERGRAPIGFDRTSRRSAKVIS